MGKTSRRRALAVETTRALPELTIAGERSGLNTVSRARKKVANATSPWVDAYEYADKFGLSVFTVWRLMREGKIPHKIVGRSKRIPRSALDAAQVNRHGDGGATPDDPDKGGAGS